MYSTKTATTNNQEFNGSYMPVGINENVVLKTVDVLTSPNGKNYIEFIFEDSDGKTASFTEWKNEKNMWIKTDEDLQNRDNQQFGRILQVLGCFYKSVPEFEGNSFVEMINWVKARLSEVDTTSKLRLKVIYDKNGYTRVSNLGIFVEQMTTDESQIKLFKRDLTERPIKADEEPAKNPFGEATSVAGINNKGADDLPF